MAEQHNNKIVANGKVLIDLTSDSVTPESLEQGKTAHDKSGAIITGINTKDSDTSDATATASEILAGKTAYVRGTKVNGSMPNIGKEDLTISGKEESKNISSGFHDGSGTVSLDPIEKEKLVPENIRQGVEILGVTGLMSGLEDVVTETKTVTSSFEQQVVSATPGKYITQFTVEAIPYSETPNSAGGTTVTIGK